ncbi:MAG: hypothetical protein H6R13_3162 [Proteobacteria bacterium]|nr:hypothetical protein [Pseudomonadota bacterium]
MQQNGAEIVSREMVAFEWLARANNPQFHEVLMARRITNKSAFAAKIWKTLV